MSEHPIFLEEMREIVESFVVETREIFEDLEADLLQLEKNPSDRQLIDKIFRAVHTVKGTSGFLSLEQLSLLAHHFEDVLNRLRRGTLAFEASMMDVLFEAFDRMKLLLQQVENRTLQALPLEDILRKLKAIAEGEPLAPVSAPTEAGLTALSAPPPESENTLKALAAHLFSEEMREIVESFVVETREIFEDLEADLLQLEKNPSDRQLIDKIFRAVHTVKGTSGFLSLEQLSLLAHHFEDVLNRLRRGTLAFEASMMDVLFEAFDRMKLLLQQVIDRNLYPIALESTLQKLQAIATGQAVAPQSQAPPKEPMPVTAPSHNEATSPNTGGDGQLAHRDQHTETIRVEVRRLDNLMDLVGELVLGRNRLLQLLSDLHNGADGEAMRELADTTAQIDFITTELQSAVMHTRMVQIGRVFNKFPRLVRDLAREFNKQIELIIEGEETELDKSLIEEISDPLVHLIRNAADHGIEDPETRRAQGKPPTGRIRLAAAQEGNHIVIEVEDDGAGIDPKKLKAKAVEKQLITEKEAAEMSDREALELIFRAGFSTAQRVSKVSGRGVGMDVVKTNITKLNGTINIHSVPGQGTRFTLKLPLTLAIIQSLLVRVARETFAIPLHTVIEVVKLEPEMVYSIKGREVVRLRDTVIPLLRIGEMLQVPDWQYRPERSYAVIVGIAHYRLGLIVDDLIGQKEIVIKPLGTYLKKVPGVAGSTILGDGRVVMILDIGELVRQESHRLRNGQRIRETVMA
ncbi:chemotaxis protein CheA [Rhodothermus bifroesti]|jgi:two-component system chemotaxis sensor kinase CheA|uniref:histidine kinase n=1 Tax=Rhodothermus marinus TaxID=29549 RepID=A0A7V2B0D9_RHOMR|nr:chemotaxis protein CheA [Rhodothermus bifroesti]